MNVTRPSLTDLVAIYEAVVYCLQVVSGELQASSIADQTEAHVKDLYRLDTFDSKSLTEADGLHRALASDSFIVALQCNAFLSGYLKGLSQLLQGSHLDVIEAYSEITNVTELLTTTGDLTKRI